MNIENKQTDGIVIVTILDPRLGADGAVSFKEHMSHLISSGSRRIVLNLSEVTFIDSTGLGAIVSVLKMLGNTGDIVICNLGTNVQTMFKLTRMDRVFRMFGSVADATSALAG